MNTYQQHILEHYHSPHHEGVLKDFTHTMKLENLSCGDEITVYLNSKDGVIQDISYQANGCAISIAAASMLADHLLGKSVKDLESMNLESVLSLLNIELTPARIKCATLPLEAFQSAMHGA